MVYLAISQNESNIQITVLLPISLRPYIRAKLRDKRIIEALEQLSIIGVYFSRNKEKKLIKTNNELLCDSSEDLFLNLMAEESIFETTASNYESQSRRSTGMLTLNSQSRRHCKTNNSCASEVLPANRRDSNDRSMYYETGQNCSYAVPQKNSPRTNHELFVDGEQAVKLSYYEHGSNAISSPTLYTQYNDKRVGYLAGNPRQSIIFMKADSDLAPEPQMESEDTVFADDSGRKELAPPPYQPPPAYQLVAIERLKRKSHKSFDDLSLCYGADHRPAAKKQLLSAASISTLYWEKRRILEGEELQKSLQSANDKECEKQLDICKDLLSVAKSGDNLKARRLIEKGADVNYRNEFGQTATIIASLAGNLGVIELLLNAGADLNQQEGFGKTALHEAAWKGEHQVAHRLISGGADINITDEEGCTPLHYASLRGRRRIVELLLIFGADASLLNKNGESAAENAYCYKHKDIMDIILASRDKKSRKEMKQQMKKKKLQDFTISLPSLNKSLSLKDDSKSHHGLNKHKEQCVIQ